MNVEFYCLENCILFGCVYGLEGFYGKGKIICYIIYRF